jgi:hypothetical protein
MHAGANGVCGGVDQPFGDGLVDVFFAAIAADSSRNTCDHEGRVVALECDACDG